MGPEQIKEAVDSLELSEKLLLIEDIWDAIAAGNGDIPLPEWQRRELDRRLEAYRDGRESLHDWNEVHKALREKYQ